QLLGAQPMTPRHLRHADAVREALHHDAGLVLARPSTAAASARDQFDPPHVRGAAVAPLRLAFKLTLKRNVKIIAHGSALRHNPHITETWERSPAYGVSRCQRLNRAGRYRHADACSVPPPGHTSDRLAAIAQFVGLRILAVGRKSHSTIGDIEPLPSEGKGHTFESCRVRQISLSMRRESQAL